ncbi:odorant receptor 49b-like [Armigeres subalbatus]|uniref:odorant receptor 49b-like n=1 Tax=Armigeres subalbatus TaxID=124917 RepID=UPI002ED1FD9C
MKYFELLDPQAAIPLGLRLMETYGLRGGEKNFLFFQFTILWETVVIVIPKMFLGYRSQDLVIRGLSELLFQLHIMIRICIFAWHRFKFESLVEIVQRVYRKMFSPGGNSTLKSIILEYNKLIHKESRGYFLYIMGCLILFSMSPVVQSVVIFIANQSRNGTEKGEYRTMMEQEFYGLDVRGNFKYYGLYAVLGGLAHYSSAALLALFVVIIICGVRSTILLFRLIQVRLSKLHELPKNEIREELRDIIDLHVDALKCIQLLEQITNLAMAVQMADCVLIWISMVLYLRKNFGVDVVSPLILFVALTAETFFLCNLMTELTSESFAVIRAIIDCEWYTLPLDVQRSLSFVLFRAQRNEGITAAKFFFMDIERFSKVTQSSYSIYVVLKDHL